MKLRGHLEPVDILKKLLNKLEYNLRVVEAYPDEDATIFFIVDGSREALRSFASLFGWVAVEDEEGVTDARLDGKKFVKKFGLKEI